MALSPKLKSLANAGLIPGDPEQLTDEMKDKIETLSEEEITHLIAVKHKLGISDQDGGNLGVCV